MTEDADWSPSKFNIQSEGVDRATFFGRTETPQLPSASLSLIDDLNASHNDSHDIKKFFYYLKIATNPSPGSQSLNDLAASVLKILRFDTNGFHILRSYKFELSMSQKTVKSIPSVVLVKDPTFPNVLPVFILQTESVSSRMHYQIVFPQLAFLMTRFHLLE